jgi:quercetin dioxygenase-like cupin family protein
MVTHIISPYYQVDLILCPQGRTGKQKKHKEPGYSVIHYFAGLFTMNNQKYTFRLFAGDIILLNDGTKIQLITF